jgi:hypothetical protein
MKRHEHKKIAVCAHQNHRRMHHILHTRSPITPMVLALVIRPKLRSVRIESEERTQAVYNLGRLEINY